MSPADPRQAAGASGLPPGVRTIVFSGIGAFLALIVAGLALFVFRRALFNWLVDAPLRRLLKDPYHENLWDLVIGMTRVPPHLLMELELRAETGELLERPLGSVVRRSNFAGILFSPAQLHRPPLGPVDPVDTSVVIGPRAQQPLVLETPILISALSYGLGVSRQFAMALAKGATLAGTAYNAGCGPLLPEVRERAARLIVQYAGTPWGQDPDILGAAHMVEIRLGHGSRAALGRRLDPQRIPPELQQALERKGHSSPVLMETPLPGGADPRQLAELIPALQQWLGGRPVAVKMAATHRLEWELEAVVAAGADVIVIDGSEGGTHSSPPIICDDFGLPTLHALHRASRFLESAGVRGQVTLIISGGLRTPSEMLKALALGADAVYVGTAVMMAATHAQISKSVPFEPVTQLVWSGGDKSESFDSDLGARTVAHFLRACTLEMAEAARALGKRSLQEINREDLLAADPDTARMFGLSPSWLPVGSGRRTPSPTSAAANTWAPDQGDHLPSGPASDARRRRWRLLPWRPPRPGR